MSKYLCRAALAALIALQASMDGLDTPVDVYSPVRANMRAVAHDWLRDEAAACAAALQRGGADAASAREPVETPTGFYKGPPASDGPGWFWTPRVVGSHDYPMDLDGSTRITNPRRGMGIYPYPAVQMLAGGGGALMHIISPVLPMSDAMVLGMGGVGRMPSGPAMGLDPVTEDLILSDVWTATGQGGPMDISSVMLPQIPKTLG